MVLHTKAFYIPSPIDMVVHTKAFNKAVMDHHRRMGTLWLWGAEGLICPKFYTDKNRSTKFY